MQKRRDSQIDEIAEKTAIDVMEMRAGKVQDRLVQSTVSLAVEWVIGSILNQEVVTGQMQRAARRAAVNPSVIKAVSNALVENDNLMASIATFKLSYVAKVSSRVKEKRKFRLIEKKAP